MRAVRKNETGAWEEILHRTLSTKQDLPTVAALREHRFQDEQAPGLYPEQPTVCSCGATPPTRPDDDYEWWIEHVITEIDAMKAGRE